MCVQKNYKREREKKNYKRISDDLKLHRSSYIQLNEMQKKLSRQKYEVTISLQLPLNSFNFCFFVFNYLFHD